MTVPIHAPAPENIRALGWFLRVVPSGSDATSFYQTRAALPLVRRIGVNQLDVYWAGEAIMFELVFSRHASAKTPGEAVCSACVPVFRVHGLPRLIDAFAAAGVASGAPCRRGAGYEARLTDNEGFQIGLRECGAGSALMQDVEAARRWQRGEAYNPGCASMPAGMQELGWIVRRVADLAAQALFFRDVVGLAPLGVEDGRLLFDLGDNAILELEAGGQVQAPPDDRHKAYSFFVLRVGDIAAFRARMKAAGVSVVNETLVYHWAEIAYFADPEGHVFGVEQAFHPGHYAPGKAVWPEGLEAERRWVERVGNAA